MGSKFSSAFKHMYHEYRAVGSIFSSAFNTLNNTSIEFWDRLPAQHSKTFLMNIDAQLCIKHDTHFGKRAVRSIFSSVFNTIHTLNIELMNRHSALHLKTFLLIIGLCGRCSALHSKQIHVLSIDLWDLEYRIE